MISTTPAGQPRWALASARFSKRDGLLYQAVFARVIGQHRSPTANFEQIDRIAHSVTDLSQLVVHRYTERLECPLSRVAAGASSCGWNSVGDDLSQLGSRCDWTVVD